MLLPSRRQGIPNLSPTRLSGLSERRYACCTGLKVLYTKRRRGRRRTPTAKGSVWNIFKINHPGRSYVSSRGRINVCVKFFSWRTILHMT